MSKHTDISNRIKKYLNGELGGPAMHLLEKEAQNDPFLMDALEGYEQAGGPQQANLANIHARLQQRTEPKVRRIIPWKAISIAASVLVFLIMGVLLIQNNRVETLGGQLAFEDKVTPAEQDNTIPSVTNGNVKQQSKIVTRPAPAPKQYIAATKKKPGSTIYSDENKIAANIAPVTEQSIADEKESVSLEERIVQGYVLNPAGESAGRLGNSLLDTGRNLLAGRMPGTKVTKSRSSAAAPVINGKVMDMVGPVPGVRVGINGTTMATVTDLNGKFTLPGNQDRVVLDVNMLGYLNKQVKVNKRDSLVIALQPKEQGLSEVTVIGYSSNRKNEEAYPVNNWAAFQKYLDENAVSADGKTGTVKLTFTVDGTGRLSDFKIADSLSEEADKIAIRLVKEGPAWLGNANGKSKNITVRIKFTTPKANNK